MIITDPGRWGEIAAMLEGYGSSDEEHPSTKASDIKPECSLCNRTFRGFQLLLKHTDAVHKLMTKQCTDCGKKFSSSKALAHHRQICTIEDAPQPEKQQPDELQPDKPQPNKPQRNESQPDEIQPSAHEPMNSTIEPQKSRKRKVNNTCNVCGRSFSSQKQLLAHHDAIYQRHGPAV